MTEQYHPHVGEVETPTPEVRELNIKDKTYEELVDDIMEVARDWSEEDQRTLTSALDLVYELHADDTHKEKPYVYHLLRSAVRAARYLEVKDPKVIVAILLHDSVEDHAKEITGVPENLQVGSQALQEGAFFVLAEDFSPTTSDYVRRVTNPPHESSPKEYDAKLAAYAEKVSGAITPVEGWVIKFCDWVDNGLGVIHGNDASPERIAHFQRKYGMVLPVLEDRYQQPDIQGYLSENAKVYVESQFARGRERLTVAA